MTLNFHAEYARLLGDLLRNGHQVSPRGQATAEIEDVVFELGPDSDDGYVAGRTSMRYLLAETAWYCSRDPSVSFIKDHASLWGRVANWDGTANSNYGEKVWAPGHYTGWQNSVAGMSEWEWAKTCLSTDHATRQAVMVIHRPEHHWLGNKDVPCTLVISFTIRDGQLKMRAHMRSSDAWFGLPYDVPFFRWLQRRMHAELRMVGLDVSVGALRMTLDSLHLYEEKRPQALAFLDKWRPAASWVNPVPVHMSLDATAALCKELLAEVACQ